MEFLSDSTQIEVRRDTEEKKREYALAGVKEYTILDPSGEHMRFYRLTPQARYERSSPMPRRCSTRGAAWLQFRMRICGSCRNCRVSSGRGLSGYVIPVLKVAVTRAEEAEAQVAAEAQRAATEAQRADAEAAARQQAVERVQELETELARLRRQRS